MIPDPGFKVTVVLKGEYLQSDAFYRHSYYIGRNRTLYRHAISRQASYTAYNPLLLRKPCKLFASVARVCQRQLAFLVTTLRLCRDYSCDSTTIRRYHDAFDYDESDRNYDLCSIRQSTAMLLRHYDPTTTPASIRRDLTRAKSEHVNFSS